MRRATGGARAVRDRFRKRTLAAIAVVLVLASLVPHGSAQGRTHRVRPGETPGAIARRYGIAAADLLAANDLAHARSLRVGQVLVVPPRGVAYARAGDTLSEIARRHRCSVDDLVRLNRLRRGATLRVGQRLVLPGYVPEDVQRDWGEPEEPGVVTLIRGERRTRVRLAPAASPVGAAGLPTVLRPGLDAVSDILRREDVEADLARHADPRLVMLLAMLSDAFGGRPMVIVSGFRDSERFTEESSRHVASAAADLRVTGVPDRAVWERCRRLRGAGCGLYPRSTFVHVDARDERTQWVDWSGPGQRPRYGTLRGPARRGHRAIPYPAANGVVPAEVAVVDAAPASAAVPATSLTATTPRDSR